MSALSVDTFNKIFPTCRRALGSRTWGRVLAAMGKDPHFNVFVEHLDVLTASMDLPGYIGDLARVEWTLHQKMDACRSPIEPTSETAVNPSLTILPVQWRHLDSLIRSDTGDVVPVCRPAHVMIWHHPSSQTLHCREAANIDLLALKLVMDRIDPKEAGQLGNATPGNLKTAIELAISRGTLMPAISRLNRSYPNGTSIDPVFNPMLSADLFTLQWHITQACDLRCRHCYDRSERATMPLDAALSTLEDFHDFCHLMHVRGQVTLTGGNPFLYPHLETVYRAADQWGFGIAILGNPAPASQLQRLLAIAQPRYIQVSLEGLEPHNDYMRGNGHFQRTLDFLKILKQLGIYSMVMLTLTQDNIDQVIPLAEQLKGRADQFTFNRLATVGEGANLQMPDNERFEQFLEAYADKAARSAHMGIKDNLFNILRHKRGEAPFGGCTGYGCGAAFNFMALLPDGEVHACRKFPSPIGSIHHHRLEEIYSSHLAQRYRTGSRACLNCSLNAACRGCLAVIHGMGLDVFSDSDPYCFAANTVKAGIDAPYRH